MSLGLIITEFALSLERENRNTDISPGSVKGVRRYLRL